MKSGVGEQFRERFNILWTYCGSWQARRACKAPQDLYTSVPAVVDLGPSTLEQRSLGMAILLHARSPDFTLAEILLSITTLCDRTNTVSSETCLIINQPVESKREMKDRLKTIFPFRRPRMDIGLAVP